MAWQLIYTSAPRLLDAGLTGFGTVARHRAIPPLVVKAVERISQFARLPGYDPSRVIFSHRVLTLGGARFHVLSRLRDAGSDYSGRTNHIAHHLIVPAAEIAAVSFAGVTPADALLQMPWLDRWDRPPEWLENSWEITISDYVPLGEVDRSWERATGNAEHRWLLVTGAAAKGCCLIVPPNHDLLPVFAASQHCQPTAQSWQTGFTTALQPADDLGDYRWMGIAADTPLRAVLESSGRPVLNLTLPASLPKPEIPRSNSVPASRAAAQGPLPPPGAVTYDQVPQNPINSPTSFQKGRKRIALGGNVNRGAEPRSWLLPALVAIVILAGGLTAYFTLNGSRKAPPSGIPQASLDFQMEVQGSSVDEIRRIKVPSSDADSRLGRFIISIKQNPAPQTFEQALDGLATLDSSVRDDKDIGFLADKIFKRLETEAWDLFRNSKPDEQKLRQYVWSEQESRKKFALYRKWLDQPDSDMAAFPGGPPSWMTAHSPSSNSEASAQAAQSPITRQSKEAGTGKKAEERQPSRVSILADWASVEDLEIEDEWLKKMKACLSNGTEIELQMQTGKGFRRGTENLRFGLSGKRLNWRDQENYRYLDLINETDGNIWRILKSDAAGFQQRHKVPKLKPSDGLRWNRREAIFEVTPTASQALDRFRLLEGQEWVLECPFRVRTGNDNALLLTGQKSAGLSEWIKTILEAIDAKPEKDLDYLKLEAEIAAANSKCTFDISQLQKPRGAADKSYEEEKAKQEQFRDKKVSEKKEEQNKIKQRLEFRKNEAAKDPLKMALESDELPARGPYFISIRMGKAKSSMVKVLELRAD
ncbi:MAG TPA: hypothetical protein VG796_01265 [Verrucomicrobiales bacterium]|nr:hypothetical protein [Verrucomicrobiales bacterium]